MDYFLRKSLVVLPVLLLFSISVSAFSSGTVPAIEDDAFFYLKMADNTVQGRGVSFDGLTETNGFHPLWMLAITGIRLLSEDPLTFLRLSFVLSAVLMTAVALLFLRRSINYSLPVTLLPLILLLRYVRDFSVMCMETSILLPVSFLILMEADRFANGNNRVAVWGIGILVALMIPSRLDSVLMAVPLFLILIRRWGRDAVLPLLLPGFVSVSAIIFINLATIGTPLTVSGMMKASGFGYNELFSAQLFRFSDPLGIFSPWGLYLLFLVLAVPVLLLKEKPVSAVVSSAFILIFTVTQLFMSQWRLWYWYAYPAVIFLAFGFPVLLQRIYSSLRISSALERAMTGVFIPALAVMSIYWGISYGTLKEDDFRYRNMQIALELNGMLPDSAVIAMGDRAGSFAYFFHGHVIQTEGLAGDVSLVNAIKAGELGDHLVSMGADYLLSWTGPHGVIDYSFWDIWIPDPAQSAVFNNLLPVSSTDEIARWAGENETAFLWRLNAGN